MKDFGLKKLYYSISEVSKLTDLEQYILRYWESEFDQLKPSKNRAGNRIYTNKDIKTILNIKKLLRGERYTIEGAKKILADIPQKAQINTTSEKPTKPRVKLKEKEPIKHQDFHSTLEEIKKFLLDLQSEI